MPILLADKGHIFPRTLLEAVVKTKPTQWGVSVLMKGSLKALKETSALELDVLDKIQKEYKDGNFLLSVSRGEKNISEEEGQPFTFLSMESGEKKPLLVGCVNGDFPSYKKDTLAATRLNMVNTFLRPKLERTFTKCGSDMAKLIKAIENEDFRELIEAACQPNGTVALFAANGQCIFYNVNPDAKKTPFGFTTDLFGVAEEELLPEKKASGLEALSDVATPIEPEKKEDAPVEEKTDEVKKEEEEKKTITDAAAQISSDNFVWVKPKKDSGAQAVDKWYNKVCQYLGITKTSDMVKARPAMRVSKDFFAKNIHVSSEVVSPPPKEQQQKYQKFEDPSSTAIGDKLKQEQSKLEVMPRASEETVKWLREGLKLQDGVSNEILQGLEKKYPSYFKVGHQWDEIRKWPFANFLALAEDKTATALLNFTLAAKLRQVESRLASSYLEIMEKDRPSDKKVAM